MFAAYDAKGNLYFPDRYDHRVRKISAKGVISVVAGTGKAGYSGDGGLAKSALVFYPTGVVADATGSVIFADSYNYRLRKIDSKGIITTIAGNGRLGYSGDEGPATTASIGRILGLALDASGNLFMADSVYSIVRMVDTSGIIHTVAGSGVPGFDGDGGPATSAHLFSPQSVLIDSGKNLYIADYGNNRIRKVDASGTISTFAGTGAPNCYGDNGQANFAGIGWPNGLAMGGGSLLISSSCTAIRAVNLGTNIITTIAGSNGGYNGDGHPVLSTEFAWPVGLVFDPSGNLTVIDGGNERIREINQQTQLVNTIAGGYVGDGGKGTLSSLDSVGGIDFDSAGNLYMADQSHHRVRKLSATGTITTFAGTGISGYTGDGGPATSATLYYPFATATDMNGNVFIDDQSGWALRKVDSTGTITTVALSYEVGGTAPFEVLAGLGVDSSGNVYASDEYACVIWRFTPAGAISVVAGVPYQCNYNGDGIPATQAMLNPGGYAGVAFDSQGNMFIGDTYSCIVRRVDVKTGLIYTVAGTPGVCKFSGDGGPAISASLFFPEGVTVDARGNLFIADWGNRRVRSVNNAGIIQTLAGTGLRGYNGNGLPAAQTNLDSPQTLALKSHRFVYVGDAIQQRVRKIH